MTVPVGPPGEAVSGLDVIIDTVGGDAQAGLYPMLRSARDRYVHATFFVVQPDAAELAHSAELAAQGRLRPVVSWTYPPQLGRSSYQGGGHDRPPGKTVLVVR